MYAPLPRAAFSHLQEEHTQLEWQAFLYGPFCPFGAAKPVAAETLDALRRALRTRAQQSVNASQRRRNARL
jgi:hypothetical protein